MDRTTTKLQITNQELGDRKKEKSTAIQLFPSLKNRASIVKDLFKLYNDFWAYLCNMCLTLYEINSHLSLKWSHVLLFSTYSIPCASHMVG